MNDALVYLTGFAAVVPELKSAVVVFAFIIFDIVSGLVKAFSTGSYSSSVMREGLFHKLSEIVCLVFGVLCDFALPYMGITLPLPIAKSIAVYVIFMETGSVVENIAVLNPGLSKYLSGIFAKLKPAEDEQGEGDDD